MLSARGRPIARQIRCRQEYDVIGVAKLSAASRQFSLRCPLQDFETNPAIGNVSSVMRSMRFIGLRQQFSEEIGIGDGPATSRA